MSWRGGACRSPRSGGVASRRRWRRDEGQLTRCPANGILLVAADAAAIVEERSRYESQRVGSAVGVLFRDGFGSRVSKLVRISVRSFRRLAGVDAERGLQSIREGD